jgi:hypothetical protein
MYPIYPLICASAAHTIKLIEQFVVGAKQPYSSPVFKSIVFLCCVAFFGLSLARVFSLHMGKLLLVAVEMCQIPSNSYRLSS